MWEYRGQRRPDFADVPGAGQESVWDYPRPPSVVPDRRHVEVRCGRTLVASSSRTVRVLETASPPTFYIPKRDITPGFLVACEGQSVCEWKGPAQYWALTRQVGQTEPVAWSYPQPGSGFRAIAGCFAFYPGRVDCRVDGERVQSQPGYFYGGWITSDVVGPFKGSPGTGHW